MDIFFNMMAIAGFALGIGAYMRVDNLEKELKARDVLPPEFDSESGDETPKS